MATGLASQLNSLKTPQTSRLLQDQDKKRASLLFNPKEAANLDRETYLNIGKNGYDELVALSSVFQQFENVFFTHSATKLERSIQDKKINEKLNKKIAEFLIYLSPYFLTDHARKALEWLIYRFQIHQYNKDEYMMLILPYHGSNQFVRALQLVDLSQNNDKWNWLKPLQKPGIQLSASTLFNRISIDNCLFELICNHIVEATSVYKEKATCLKTLYIFYTFAICGGIDKSPQITELQVNHLLPALLKGLKSSISDFAASAIVILGKLSMKQRLNVETMTRLLLTALKNPILKHELLTLIFILYESPNNEMGHVPYEIVNKMAEYSWLCDEIIKIKTSGIDIIYFIVPFLKTAIAIVLKNPDEMINVKTTIKNIIQKIVFDDDEIDMILRDALTPGLLSNKLSNLSKSFLSELYGSLEVRYSARFDEYLKALMKESETCLKSKESLQFLMSWHAGAERAKDSLNAFDKLNHFAPEYRISALNDISAGNIELSDNFEGMVKKSIIERFNDDNVDVVKALLDFPIKRLKSLFPSDNLIERLMILLSQCHTEKKHVLAKPALKLLLNLCVDGDDTSVFIAILPYLFPTTDEEIEIALQILNSVFSKKNPYLQDVSKEINEDSTAKSIGDAAFHSLLESELLPPTENILTTMKLSSNSDATSLFFNFVLLGSVCRRKIGEISPKTFCEIIELSSEMIKKYPHVKSIPSCNRLTSEVIQSALQSTSKGILPLQAGTYVLEMVFRRLDFKSILFDFENNYEFTQLIICIFELMLEGVHSTHTETKRHYSWILKIFVQRHFQTPEMMIEFLAQGFIPPVKPQTSFQCLKMALYMFNRVQSVQWIFEKKIFVTNLLIALSRENKTCREAATEVLKRLFQTFNLEMNGIAGLLSELSKRSTEIAMDHEQLPFILYTLLSPDPDVSCQLPVNLCDQMEEAREFLFTVSLDESMPIHIKSQLLEVLAHVNGVSVLKTLTPRGLELMKIVNNDSDKPFTKMALKNILYRFNSTTVDALKMDNVWHLFEIAFSNHQLRIPTENDHLPPSTIIMKQIDDVFFANAGDIQKKILAKLVDVVTDCESSSIVAAANRAVQRIKINGQSIVDELEIMKNAELPDESGKVLTAAQAKRRSRRLEMTKRPELINTREWKRGITILEFIQRAENIDNEYLMIPILFDLLRMCLSFEEQSPVEYTNQLLLSTIYNLSIKKLPIPNAHLQVDLIAQCIRTSQNPQTHHHALLVLVELFKIADIETALNNIMPIFTFMGSSVLRQDDAYSIQIISKTIETIVPIINASNDEKHACEILRIFVVSLPDIPEHRRQPLFVKLLQLLENHLHLFYLLTFTAEVLGPIKKQKDKKELSQRLEFALRISQEFSPKKMIDVCVKITEFIKLLPIEIDETSKKTIKFSHPHIFDVAKNKPKQLQDYKYLILQFLNNLLSSVDFVNSVAMLNDNETNEIQSSFDNMIVQLLMSIESTTKLANINQGKSKEDKSNYWRTLLHNLYEILNAVNSLLPNQVFITSVMKLMVHDELTVRRKALELLNTRLYYKKFNQEDHELLLTLIIPLLEIVSKHGKMLSTELEKIQQTSLRSLQLLAKLLAVKNPEYFKPVLELTTEYMRTKDGPLLSCVVLCVAELVSTMKIHALPLLNKFVPSILHLVKTHCHQDSAPDHLVISIICAMQKIVDSVANFFSLFLDTILVELCELTTRYVDLDNKNIAIIVSRLKATAQKLASCMPLRVMLPAVGKTYNTMLEMKSYKLIPALMSIFSECFEYLRPSDINAAIPDLANFFLRVLQFREDIDLRIEDLEEEMEIDGDENNILKDIRVIEEAAGKSFVCLVLKLSEAQFRPLCYKLYDWAARNPDKKLRSITFYRLSSNIAESLKLLSAQFSGHFLTHAAQLLVQNNLEIQNEPSEQTLENEKNRIELIESILSTLNKVFTYDANDFVNQERFETLCQPIVDQIENTVGTKAEFIKRADNLIVPCVASFASAIQDDSLHKQLVYQVLLKTRHNKSYVRSTALSALVEIARKLGEDFMPLLPETVPFLAELLEDEDDATEKLAQNAVRTLEEILGEPLQKYF